MSRKRVYTCVCEREKKEWQKHTKLYNNFFAFIFKYENYNAIFFISLITIVSLNKSFYFANWTNKNGFVGVIFFIGQMSPRTINMVSFPEDS